MLVRNQNAANSSADRERVKDDLRGLVRGEVRSDPIFRQLYASDASIYEIQPLAIVRPRGLADVVATVRYAAENKLAVHARGAGTGLAGESLGGGVVIDFSRFMRRVLSVDEGTVRIQPGVVHAKLNEHLRPLGRQFGPDPAMSSVTTMGSVIAIDAGGSHWLKYGSARSHVKSLQVVLADGSVQEFGSEAFSGEAFDAETLRGRLIKQLAGTIGANESLIAKCQPRSLVNRCGYQLSGVLSPSRLDVAKLLSGSEGTLALITEATVTTDLVPRYRGVALLFFDRLESAAKSVMEVLSFSPSACDLMDRRHLSLARESTVEYDQLIPEQTEAVLLVEHEAETLAEVRDRLTLIIDRIRRKRRLAFHAVQAQDRKEIDLYWKLARKVVPTLYRLPGATRPVPCVEDLAVPPRELPEFLVRMQNVLKQHQVTASLFGHAGHGQLHLRPFLDLSNPADVSRMAALAGDLYDEVLAVGGTISGEHADGLSRTPYIERQYGPLVDVFREVKRIFDPGNIFNPGKIVGDDPDLLTKNLRPFAAPPLDRPLATVATSEPVKPAPAVVGLQLRWTGEELDQTARSCNGCGACRSQLSDVRMCPVFRQSPGEEASPRAKANMMRAVLSGSLEVSAFTDDEFKRIADLCVNCHMCSLECPAGVDIPKLMVEAKGLYVRTNGLSTHEWAMARVDSLSAFASKLSPLANWALKNRVARWLLEKATGIAQARKLPRLAARSFMRVAARRKLSRPSRRSGAKVLYFVDTYANYHDPQLAEAFVDVLEHNGISVYVHPAQLSSGMPLFSLGALGRAKRQARHNVAILAEAVRLGYSIVATEPSAALCLTSEYPALVDDDDARLVAEHTSEACQFLWKLHQAGKLQLDLKPVNATLGYHTPCHVRAMQQQSVSCGESLLKLIPALVVTRIEAGCSGMAGTYGLQRENFRSSLRAGIGLVRALRSSQLQAGVTECSACKMQMEQGADKPTLHPIKLLALSYGLLPEAADLLASHGEELVVS